MSKESSTLTNGILLIMRPLVRLLLKRGIAFGAFSELVKKMYVDLADSEFSLPGKEQSIGRIATISGLTRKDVGRLLNEVKAPSIENINQNHNRAARVLTAWAREPEYNDEDGEPAELPLRGDNSFTELVKRFSGDVAASSISDELIRIGAIETTTKNRVKLVKNAYIPPNESEKLAIGCQHISNLMNTVNHNIQLDDELPLFERSVAYNSIPKASREKMRATISELSEKYIKEFDKLVAKNDIRLNPQKLRDSKKTCRIGVGLYYFEKNEGQDD
ncbi:MAG: hypothetical protein ACJAUP_002233 [Cellvibrionaceae bacterium]|jgi:hypothetical protein